MAKELIVEELTEAGPRELARLRASRVPVGREASDGLLIPVEGLSRNHGLLIQAKNHWLYVDQGSTNGSWVNGDRAFAGAWKVIRSGDTLQLATLMLRLTEGGAAPQIGGGDAAFPPPLPLSLIVLAGEQVRDEYPVPEVGQALVIGGSGADLAIDGDLEEGPAAVIERRDGHLSLARQRSDLVMHLNGEPFGELGTLHDNDQISVGGFSIVVQDPRARIEAKRKAAAAAMQPSKLDSEPVTKMRNRLAFGQAPQDPDSIEATRAIDPEEIERLRKGFAGAALDEDTHVEKVERYALLEDSIIMILGIGLLGALLGILVWWLFR